MHSFLHSFIDKSLHAFKKLNAFWFPMHVVIKVGPFDPSAFVVGAGRELTACRARCDAISRAVH
jgi:hypothetical protein